MLHSNVSKALGFTLLELIIVLAIVGILMAIGIPSLIALKQRAELSQAMDLVVASLQEAQRSAIQRNESCILTFDKTEDKILGEGGCLLSESRQLPGSIDIDYTGATGDIRYGIRGNTTTNKSIVLIIRDAPQNTRCLTVSAPLGIIRLGSYDRVTSSCRKQN